MKINYIGPGYDTKEVKMLNRIIRYEGGQWQYEADPRHSDIIVEEMGMGDSRGTKTPCERARKDETEEEIFMNNADASKYRQITARANYLASDRPDIQYAVKVACQRMARPRVFDWEPLKS